MFRRALLLSGDNKKAILLLAFEDGLFSWAKKKTNKFERLYFSILKTTPFPSNIENQNPLLAFNF